MQFTCWEVKRPHPNNFTRPSFLYKLHSSTPETTTCTEGTGQDMHWLSCCVVTVLSLALPSSSSTFSVSPSGQDIAGLMVISCSVRHGGGRGFAPNTAWILTTWPATPWHQTDAGRVQLLLRCPERLHHLPQERGSAEMFLSWGIVRSYCMAQNKKALQFKIMASIVCYCKKSISAVQVTIRK